MASADGRIVIDIELEDGSVVRGLGDIGDQADRVGKRSSSAFGKVGSALKGVGTVAVGVVAGVGALYGSIAALSIPLVKAAADSQALNSQFSQVFAGIERAAENSLASIGKATSINTGRLRASFVQIAAFAKTTGVDAQGALDLSSRALVAAADSAAFYDRSIEDTTESLQSFLKGNFENDAALGIAATETTRNAVANRLYSKSFKDLDEAQKQLALLTLVEDGNNLSGALGQAARESDGLENVLGNLKQAYEDFKIALGDTILETAINLLKGLTNVINNIDISPLTSGLTYVVSVLQRLANILKPVLLGLYNSFVETLSNIRAFFSREGENITSTAKTVFTTIYTVIKSIIDTIVPFVSRSLAVLVGFWERDGQRILDTVVRIFGMVYGTIKNIVDTVIQLLGPTLENISILVDKYGARILNFLSIVTTGVLAIVNFLLPIVSTLIREAINFVLRIIDGGLNIILGIVDVFAGLFTGDFSRVWEGIQDIFSGAISIITAFLTTGFIGYIIKTITAFTKRLIKVFTTAWKTIANLTKTIFTPIVAFFSRIWNSISSATLTVWNVISSFLSSTWNTISSVISAVWEGIVSVFRTVWNTISGIFTTVLGGIVSTVNGYWQVMSESVNSIWNNIVLILQNVWTIIKNVFFGAILIIFDLVTGNWERLRSDTKQIWENISKAFSTIWTAIKKIFTDTLKLIYNTVKQTWTNITTSVTTTFNAIRTFFVNLWNSIVKFFVDTFNKLKNTAQTSSNSVKKTISDVWNSIKSFFTTTLSNIVTTVRTKFADIYNSASSKLNEVKTFFSDTWASIKKTASGIDLYQIGKDIVQGLIDGIGSLATKVSKKVKEIVNLIPEGIRELLNINSPSKVTTELGEFAGEGVEVGLDNSIRGIKKATNNVSKAAIPNNIVNRLRGSSVGIGGVSAGLLKGGTNTSNTSNINNSTNPVYNINMQTNETQELERVLRRFQFGY